MIVCLGNSCIDILMLSEIIKIIGGIVTAITAIILACVAVKGYTSWKAQLKGKTEYESAKRLLRSLYKVRDAVREYRFFVNKDFGFHDPQNPESSESAYDKQGWNKVLSVWQDFNVDALEAEALWGEQITQFIDPLMENIATLQVNRFVYLKMLEKPKTASAKMITQTNEVLFDNPSEDNKFTNDFNNSVKNLEEEIKKHLKL